jgi:uncharacterized membrane protein YbaN (DUF454 family)
LSWLRIQARLVERQQSRQPPITTNRMNQKKQLSKQKKRLFIILGILCAAIGLVGIFIPILPTTPFLLAAEFFFARSSEKFLNWLFSNRFFGPYLENYKSGQGLSIKDKVITITLLWLTIGTSMFFFIDSLWVKILLALIAMGVTTHLIRIKTYQPKLKENQLKNDCVQNTQLTDNPEN